MCECLYDLCVCSTICECECASTTAPMLKSEDNLRSQSSPFTLFETGSLAGPGASGNSPISVSCLDREHHEYWHTLLSRFWGSKLGASHLQGEHSTHWAMSPGPCCCSIATWEGTNEREARHVNRLASRAAGPELRVPTICLSWAFWTVFTEPAAGLLTSHLLNCEGHCLHGATDNLSTL